MQKDLPIRTISLLVTASFIAVALVVVIAVNERTTSESLEQTTAKFNESLLDINRDVQQREDSRLANDSVSDQSATARVGDGDTGAEVAGLKPTISSSSNLDTSNQTREFIKPLVGERSVESEAPEFAWLDPHTSVDVIADAADARNIDGQLYGWIQLQSDMKPSELQALIQQYGAEVLSTNAKFVRVKLPSDRQLLASISDVSVVEGMGLMPVEAKIPPTLMGAFDNISSGSEVPVFITTMDSDDDGSMRRQLIAMGATVGQWENDIRTYSANVDRITLDSVLSADFVEVVSPNTVLRPFLAGTTSDLGVDLYRTYSASTGTFSGDSGLS